MYSYLVLNEINISYYFHPFKPNYLMKVNKISKVSFS